MTADLNNLVRLKKPQIQPAAEVLTLAFQDYPLYTYFIPDASERKNKLRYLHEYCIRYSVLYGEVYATSPNLEGIAAWLPPRVYMTLWRKIRSGGFLLMFKLGTGVISRKRYFDHHISSIHKHHAPLPHWYLFYLAVAPMFQGKGYASTLLKPMFTRIDKEHLPCYVETEQERNVSIYQHYGFKVVEEGIIPGTEICLWAMLREKSS